MFRVLSMLKMAHFQEHIIDCKEKTENLISRSLPHYLGRSLGKNVLDASTIRTNISTQIFPHGPGGKTFQKKKYNF